MIHIYINRLKQMFQSTLLKNGLWLYALQFFQVVIPLITLPYITRVLGAEKYGAFCIALNIIAYFEVVVEYGFNLSGSRKVALANKKDIDGIYSSIMLAKGLLCLLSFIGMGIFLFFFDYTLQQQKYMLILFLLVCGIAIQQTWLFQGLQKMKFITISTVIARTLSVIAIFCFVKTENDISLYCLLYSSTHIISGVISAIISRVCFNVKFRFVGFCCILSELKDGLSLFLTSAMSKVMTGIGVTILGFVATETDVGIYSAIQKIPLIMIVAYRPIGQILYPYISKQFSVNYKNGISVVIKAFIIVGVVFGLLCLIIMVNAQSIVSIMFGKEYLSELNCIYPLTIWSLLSIINNVIGIQTLVASGYKKQYTQAFTISAVSVLIFNVLFGIKYSIYGVAYATLASEVILTLCMLFYLKEIRKKAITFGVNV
ncbi:flippase [Desulforamulus aeronauticus]|uniref:Polysaccharide transporter, PST family n=1 Tax=Desulforamulus aeronauticus DSM 10349 TaxID=1121421 RepID=A0A1M6V3Q2_9FIRM|nr:flippase [Desulforamulus aeronauticus]SHK76127.1 polysaccharide transporter, PST family [Desulforamulus aeronauticus DSM 10349]